MHLFTPSKWLQPSQCTIQQNGFTLVELLTSICLIVLITTLGTISLGGTNGSTKLTTSGNSIVELLSLARQQAISKNTMTALVILTKDPIGKSGVAYRTFTYMEYGENGWVQRRQWQIFPDGILVDPNKEASSFLVDASSSVTAIVPVFQGQNMASGYVCRYFSPTGSLLNVDQPVTLRLVEASLNSDGSAFYRHPVINGIPSNYYDVSLLATTGLTKIIRR